MRESKYSESTEGVHVSVLPEPIEEETSSSEGVYTFAYTITIENRTDKTVQLLERHWIIKSAEIQIGEVTGPGVVGEKPTLKPGERFQYTSGAVIHDPVGSMEGSYKFKDGEGIFFEVKIPRFELQAATYLH